MSIPKIDEVENIARFARLNMAKDGFLAQTAFIWTGEKVAIIQGRPMGSQGDKIAWSTIVRRACVELAADHVLTITEIWAAHLMAAEAAPDDLLGLVKDKPGAYEAVMLHLESMDGTWTCIIPIVKSPGQPNSFPMPRYWTEGQVDGLLANFIPDKKASAYKKA